MLKALRDPDVLSVSPIVSSLMTMLRIAITTKKFQRLTIHMVTELCYLYYQIPSTMSSEKILVLSSVSDKVQAKGCGCTDVTICLTENFSMAILIGANSTSTIHIAKDSSGYHGYSIEVFNC